MQQDSLSFGSYCFSVLASWTQTTRTWHLLFGFRVLYPVTMKWKILLIRLVCQYSAADHFRAREIATICRPSPEGATAVCMPGPCLWH